MASPSSSSGLEATDAICEIKMIQFLDRHTPIILQDHNEPRSLIAIANILLLRNHLDLGVNTTQVSEHKLLELIKDCLMAVDGDNHDENLKNAIDLLPRLTNDIYVDVKFRSKGEFSFPENVIFGLLDIPLYHCWIVDPKVWVLILHPISVDHLLDSITKTKERKAKDI